MSSGRPGYGYAKRFRWYHTTAKNPNGFMCKEGEGSVLYRGAWKCALVRRLAAKALAKKRGS